MQKRVTCTLICTIYAFRVYFGEIEHHLYNQRKQNEMVFWKKSKSFMHLVFLLPFSRIVPNGKKNIHFWNIRISKNLLLCDNGKESKFSECYGDCKYRLDLRISCNFLWPLLNVKTEKGRKCHIQPYKWLKCCFKNTNSLARTHTQNEKLHFDWAERF